MQSLLFILVGAAAGVLSGLIGIGGGVFISPVLVLLFGMTQHMAQGTTLALLVPPIGILAVWPYYKAGNVNFKVAALVCLGFLFGGLAGGKIANALPDETLRRVFGVALILIGLKMTVS